MKNIETEIKINANPSIVWEVLTNLNSYNEWNPFIIESKGKIKLGKQITNTMLNGEKKMTFKPIVTQIKEHKRFEWLGSLWIKGLFDGRHYFELKKLNDESTLLVHGEYFSGLLSGVILNSIKQDTLNGFSRMNEALKNRVEQNETNRNTTNP
ncbi:MAG: SRPBCC family protein [Salibacteraceae bacterium]